MRALTAFLRSRLRSCSGRSETGPMYSKFQSHHCKLLDLFLSSQTKFNVANLEGCIPKQGPSSPGSCLLYLHFAVGQCPFLRQAIVGPFMEDHLLPHSGTVSGSPCTACLTGRAQATQSCNTWHRISLRCKPNHLWDVADLRYVPHV